MANLPRVGLSPFSMTEEEIEAALNMPVDQTMRFDVKLLPDSHEKPRYIRRVIATGFYAWKARGDRPLARLIQHLLYLYFTGQLQVVSPVSAGMRSTAYVEDLDDDDDFDDDFGFTER